VVGATVALMMMLSFFATVDSLVVFMIYYLSIYGCLLRNLTA